jgi:hypothetical protein
VETASRVVLLAAGVVLALHMLRGQPGDAKRWVVYMLSGKDTRAGDVSISDGGITGTANKAANAAIAAAQAAAHRAAMSQPTRRAPSGGA